MTPDAKRPPRQRGPIDGHLQEADDTNHRITPRIDSLTELWTLVRELDNAAGITAGKAIADRAVDPVPFVLLFDELAVHVARIIDTLVDERSRLRDRLARRELEIIAERRALRKGGQS